MFGGKGTTPVSDDFEHLAPAHVDEGDQALERAGVAVVLLAVRASRPGSG